MATETPQPIVVSPNGQEPLSSAEHVTHLPLESMLQEPVETPDGRSAVFSQRFPHINQDRFAVKGPPDVFSHHPTLQPVLARWVRSFDAALSVYAEKGITDTRIFDVLTPAKQVAEEHTRHARRVSEAVLNNPYDQKRFVIAPMCGAATNAAMLVENGVPAENIDLLDAGGTQGAGTTADASAGMISPRMKDRSWTAIVYEDIVDSRGTFFEIVEHRYFDNQATLSEAYKELRGRKRQFDSEGVSFDDVRYRNWFVDVRGWISLDPEKIEEREQYADFQWQREENRRLHIAHAPQEDPQYEYIDRSLAQYAMASNTVLTAYVSKAPEFCARLYDEAEQAFFEGKHGDVPGMQMYVNQDIIRYDHNHWVMGGGGVQVADALDGEEQYCGLFDGGISWEAVKPFVSEIDPHATDELESMGVINTIIFRIGHRVAPIFRFKFEDEENTRILLRGFARHIVSSLGKEYTAPLPPVQQEPVTVYVG